MKALFTSRHLSRLTPLALFVTRQVAQRRTSPPSEFPHQYCSTLRLQHTVLCCISRLAIFADCARTKALAAAAALSPPNTDSLQQYRAAGARQYLVLDAGCYIPGPLHSNLARADQPLTFTQFGTSSLREATLSSPHIHTQDPYACTFYWSLQLHHRPHTSHTLPQSRHDREQTRDSCLPPRAFLTSAITSSVQPQMFNTVQN